MLKVTHEALIATAPLMTLPPKLGASTMAARAGLPTRLAFEMAGLGITTVSPVSGKPEAPQLPTSDQADVGRPLYARIVTMSLRARQYSRGSGSTANGVRQAAIAAEPLPTEQVRG